MRRCTSPAITAVGIVGEHDARQRADVHSQDQVVALHAVEAHGASRSPSARGWASSGCWRCVRGRHVLQPDGLPDAGGAWIPDGVGLELPVLLAAWLGQICGSSSTRTTTSHDASAPTSSVMSSGKRGVPALVLAAVMRVDPDGRPVVDGAEVQEQAARRARPGHVERAPVPAAAKQAGVVDAAGGRLGRKRDHDGVGPRDIRRRVTSPVGVDGKLPGAVQRDPPLPLKLWAGITMRAGGEDRDMATQPLGSRDALCGRAGQQLPAD